MKVRIYEYSKCSTCKAALHYLDSKKVEYEKLPIVERPPTMAELRRMLQHCKADGGSFKNLFNTSGEHYRKMKLAEKIKAGKMAEEEALELLSKNGKLIKRPFLLTEKKGCVGFKPEIWAKLFF